MKYRNILFAVTAVLLTASCGDMLDTDSEIVEFEENNHLNSVSDTVYSVLGIINRIQVIAERNALIGDVHSDLIATTGKTSTDLKALSDFTAGIGNRYNQVSDYYAVINNCNNYLAKADTMLTLKGVKVFKREYVAVKVYRAWAYLQAVQLYGKLPFVTAPVYTESQAQAELQKPFSDIHSICNSLIDDLKPYVDERVPVLGGNVDPKYFIPIRVMLGDLFLWANRYEEAARYYYDYLTLREAPKTVGTYQIYWGNIKDFSPESRPYYNNSYNLLFTKSNSEVISWIPLESQPYYGNTSQVYYLYNSDATRNNYYVELSPSKGMRELFRKQRYTQVYIDNNNNKDTLSGPDVDQILNMAYTQGDLRYTFNIVYTEGINRDEYSPYSTTTQNIRKMTNDAFILYRVGMVYLRFAEALNRLGYTQTAMAILKYGLCDKNINDRIDETERAAAARFLVWDPVVFTTSNSIGIHERGCGFVDCDTISYIMPQPATALATRQDTVDYQIPLVEDMIIEEMALEGAYEGNRFYDLMRVALRREDNSYLADRVALRNGTEDNALRELLKNRSNWYLPLK